MAREEIRRIVAEVNEQTAIEKRKGKKIESAFNHHTQRGTKKKKTKVDIDERIKI